jgi:quercetin dioxygenase-like cupin family protein
MVDRSRVEQSWSSRGFTCGLWTDPPGQTWEGYIHDEDELVMLLEGKLELEMQGRVWSPEIGEEVLIPARVRHSVRNVGHGMARWLYGYKR